MEDGPKLFSHLKYGELHGVITWAESEIDIYTTSLTLASWHSMPGHCELPD
jgi:hypothetical protein